MPGLFTTGETVDNGENPCFGFAIRARNCSPWNMPAMTQQGVNRDQLSAFQGGSATCFSKSLGDFRYGKWYARTEHPH